MHIPIEIQEPGESGTFPAMVAAMRSLTNRSDIPSGPDTRTDAEVRSQYVNGLPTNKRNRYINQKRKSDKARKAAKKARRKNRR